MTFWQAFFRTLRWRPKQAFAGLYWHLTRRKVRARNRLRVGAAQAPFAYDHWIETVEEASLSPSDADALVANWKERPKFSILLHGEDGVPDEQVKRTLASVKEQYYRHWELIVPAAVAGTVKSSASPDRGLVVIPGSVDGTRGLELAIAAASGDYLIPLRAGHLMALPALIRFAEAVQGKGGPAIAYADQDGVSARGSRVDPWFKPQWDAEMFLSQDYVSAACAIDLHLARTVVPLEECADAGIYALLLAVSGASGRPIVHIPHVLCHVGRATGTLSQAGRVCAVGRHLGSLGASAAPGPFDTVKVQWPLPQPPPGVSIVIPTRDKVGLLRACVDSVLASTTYPDFELIIVDNGSTEPAALSYMSAVATDRRVRLLTYDHPFNYSAINNFAAGHSSAPFLCLLNNDTEVVGGDWLTEMMRYAVRPEVGAVGAKLLYDDGSIQHAGVVIGVCDAAGHAHRFAPGDGPGYFGQPHITHQVSAVTAACLVVEKSKFDAVGGLDEQALAVAYNDVDLCLKLEKAGWRNMYVPHAVLLHHESKSRGQDMSPANIDRYMRELSVLQERWGTKAYVDPRLNINLDRFSETFILRL